jgi:hypothetical protein
VVDRARRRHSAGLSVHARVWLTFEFLKQPSCSHRADGVDLWTIYRFRHPSRVP